MKEHKKTKSTLRDDLIQAGVMILYHGRLEDISMRKIAALCHATPHAIYNHFKNKKEYIAAVNSAMLVRINEFAMRTLFDGTLSYFDKIYRLLLTFVEGSQKYPLHLDAVDMNFQEDPFFEITPHGDGKPACRSKYTGLPDVKTLNSLPPSALAAFLADAPDMLAQVLTPPAELALQEEKADTCLGQISLLAFINGISCMVQDGMIDGEEDDREETLRRMLRLFLDRTFGEQSGEAE